MCEPYILPNHRYIEHYCWHPSLLYQQIVTSSDSLRAERQGEVSLDMVLLLDVLFHRLCVVSCCARRVCVCMGADGALSTARSRQLSRRVCILGMSVQDLQG
jgi:hypothetical protein